MEYSEFYKVSGDPVSISVSKAQKSEAVRRVWFALWIALSVFFIVEFGFGDGHMPLVVKAIVIGLCLSFYGMILSGIAEKKRKYTVKYRKTTAP